MAKSNLAGFFKRVGVLVLTFSLASSVAAQDAVRIGTSSVGSTFYSLAVGASEVISKHAGLNATVEPLGGSAANVVGIGDKRIEFAIANSFAAFGGYYGQFDFKKRADLRVVLQGSPSFRGFVVRKGSGIRTFKDLDGRTIVAKRRALPELELIMDAVIKAYGLNKASMKLVATTTTSEVFTALKVGTVDAAIVPFSRRAPHIEEPARDGVIDFLYMSGEKRQEILKSLPSVFYGEALPSGDYYGQTQPWHLFGLNTYLITHPGVSEETVYRVTKALLDNLQEFATYYKGALEYNAKATLSNIALPFHSGAMRYFKEKGLWTPALEAKQAELLKR